MYSGSFPRSFTRAVIPGLTLLPSISACNMPVWSFSCAFCQPAHPDPGLQALCSCFSHLLPCHPRPPAVVRGPCCLPSRAEFRQHREQITSPAEKTASAVLRQNQIPNWMVSGALSVPGAVLNERLGSFWVPACPLTKRHNSLGPNHAKAFEAGEFKRC